MWDVLYVVDASTSMGEPSKIRGVDGQTNVEAVKRGIMQVVKASPFPFGARAGAMGFRAPTKAMGMILDSKGEMVQRVLPLTPVVELQRSPEKLRDSLDSLITGGATPTGEAIRAAVEIIHEDAEGPKRIKKVIVVTDEKANVGAKPQEILDARLVRRAIIDIVALGTTADAKTFETLASRSGGKFSMVNTINELAMALDPKIPYAEREETDPLLAEAERVAAVLKATDAKAVSYRGLAIAAEAVRLKIEQKLQEVISLEGQSRADADMAISAAMHDPKWPTMSMREFADRVWSKSSELAKMQSLEARYRQSLQLLKG